MDSSLAAASKPSLTIKRRLKAPPDRVFSAWTDPLKIARWFGPGGGGVVSAEADLRIGGRYRIVFRTEDGDEHDVGGVYREVVTNRKLVFTWAWHTMPERESLVTLALEGDGMETVLTLTHAQFFDEPARDRHHKGWNGALDKLEAFVAQSA